MALRTKPFVVIQNGKPLFTVHAYSAEQARALVAAKVAGETIVVALDGAPRMIPDTKSGLSAMACVSAMQKSIRRGLEREAMQFACELIHTSKAFHAMVCNRLIVICHEDLDTLAAPWVVPFVSTALAQSQERYAAKKIGEARLMIGNCIRIMCRSPKSRAGCHFAAAIGLRSMLEGFAPTIPDFALDQHTLQARRWVAVSTTSAARARCSSRRRQSRTLSRTKPTGCGRSSSGANNPCRCASQLAYVGRCLARLLHWRVAHTP